MSIDGILEELRALSDKLEVKISKTERELISFIDTIDEKLGKTLTVLLGSYLQMVDSEMTKKLTNIVKDYYEKLYNSLKMMIEKLGSYISININSSVKFIDISVSEGHIESKIIQVVPRDEKYYYKLEVNLNYERNIEIEIARYSIESNARWSAPIRHTLSIKKIPNPEKTSIRDVFSTLKTIINVSIIIKKYLTPYFRNLVKDFLSTIKDDILEVLSQL